MQNFVPELNAIVNVSGNAVPTVSTLKKFARIIKDFGYDAMYISFDDVMKLDDEPLFGYQRGRYDVAEMNELDDYCSSIGIELRPAISTVGHLFSVWKNYYPYGKVMEGKGVLMVDNDDTYALIEKMFSAASKFMKSRKIHIGLDDAYYVGRNRHLNQFGFQKFHEILFRHARRVQEIAKKYGYECEIWSEEFVNRNLKDELTNLSKEQIQEMIKGQLPSDITISHRDIFVNDADAIYAGLAKNFKMSDNVSMTTAVMKGYGFTCDNDFTIKAVKSAVDAVKSLGVKKYNMQLLSDFGGEQSLFCALPSLYFASECLNGKADCKCCLDKTKFKKITGADFDALMLLDLPNKPYMNKEYKSFNTKSYFYFYNDLLFGFMDAIVSNGIGLAYADCAKKLLETDGGEYDYLLKTAGALCKVLENKAELGKKVKTAYDKGDKDALINIADNVIPKVIDDINAFYTALDYQWYSENKSFGFEVQEHRWGAITARLLVVAEKLKDYANGKIDSIRELMENRLVPDFYQNMPNFFDVKKSEGINEDNYVFYAWSFIVSAHFTS